MFCFQISNAQADSTQTKEFKQLSNYYNPLSPAKAAFYSAIVPGMGQIYNKKFWKAPIIWGAMGVTTYLFIDNNNEFNRYRTAFKLRESGLQDEFTRDDGSLIISRNGLISAQKVLKKNRDLSLLGTVLIYIMQIVEASVNAHLLQFNTNNNLSVSPVTIPSQKQFDIPKVGFKLTYTF